MKPAIFCFSLVTSVDITYGWADTVKTITTYGPIPIILQLLLNECNHDRYLDLDVSDIKVYFYDYSRSTIKVFSIDYAAKEILSYKHLKQNKAFLFYVGGYTSHINGFGAKLMRKTFRNITNTYLIIFDHHPYTHEHDGYIKSYERSVTYVYYIGKAIGIMLATLYWGGISAKEIHCVGHSLGAQILANVGEIFIKKTDHRISRITALDPAGPCFKNSDIENQIRSGLAEHVDIYHCNAGVLGTANILGDVNFIVNGGSAQPHCKTSWLPSFTEPSASAICSHRACVNTWVATVHNPKLYKAYKCDHEFTRKGNCHMTLAGYWNPKNSSGIYKFSTKDYLYF